MKYIFLGFNCLFLSVVLMGCGGGGGGSGGADSQQNNTPPTTTVDVFVSAANSGLSYPKLMAFFGSDLYVVDASTAASPANGTVAKFNSAGVRQGSIGSFIDPFGIAFYTDGTTFVTGRKPFAGTGLLELNREMV